MFENSAVSNPPEVSGPAVQVSDSKVEELYRELAACMHAKDDKGVKRVFQDLLDTGRSRQEIVSEVIRLLDNSARIAQQQSNGADRPPSAGPTIAVELSSADPHHNSTAWPKVSPQLSDDAGDQKPVGIPADQTPHEPKPGQQTGPRQRNRSKPRPKSSESSPKLEAEQKLQIVPENTAILPGRASKSTRIRTSAKKSTGAHIPLDAHETHGQSDVEDKREEATAADRELASDLPEKPLSSFFGDTSPQQVGVRFESVQPSVPERLASKLQGQSPGSITGTTESVKESAAAQADDIRAHLVRLPKGGWRPSAGAIRLLTGTSILAAVIGVFYVLFGLYGNEIEQDGAGTVRSVATWLQDLRSNGRSPSSEPAITEEKTVNSEQAEAGGVSNSPKNETITDEEASSKVAALSSAGNASKPGEGSVEATPAPNLSIGAPTASPVELPTAVTPDRPSEPATKGRLGRLKLATKTLPTEIPPRKPTPPNTQPLSSAPVPAGVSESVPQSSQPPAPQQAPSVPARPEVASIDAGGLVTRGDQLLGMRDVASARLLYERAARAGDGQGALRMGMTFDPVFLERSGLPGVRGDPAQARSWYNRAAALGNSAAEELKNVLTSTEK
jgi:hypothetical protein